MPRKRDLTNKTFVSCGANTLLNIIKQIFPYQKIIKEHHIGEGLRLDYFLPHLNFAFEYQGVQHYVYTEHFHKDRQGFMRSQKRDLRKAAICEDQEIILICIAYNEDMSREVVSQKIEEALNE